MANNFTYDVEFIPFTNIKDFIPLNDQPNPYNHSYEPNTPCTDFRFNSFKTMVCVIMKKTDPDNNLYNGIVMSCKHYTEQQLHYNIQLTKAMGISTIHFNVLTKTLTK